MSFNQLRSDKSEVQYRKAGRSFPFSQQRSSSGAAGKGGGGGIAPSSSSSSSSLPSNTSFKKSSKDQAVQQKANSQSSIKLVDSTNAPTTHNVQNGAKEQTMPPASVLPAGSFSSRATETPNPQRDIPKSMEAVPKAQAPHPAAMNSATATAMPLTKTHMEPPKPFMLQFGSLSPVSMSGMQIPARTSSAPPNLDEQKHDLARLDPHEPVPSQNAKHKPLVEDASTGAHGGAEGEKLVPRRKMEEAQAQANRPPIPAQKPANLPVPVVSMQVPFQQPQMSMQFGSPNSQIQSQIAGETSLQMPIPMPLSMASAAQMPQPLFVQGLQPHIHAIPPHGIMHQAQGLNYAPQMPPHMLPQMGGNLGVRMTPQYPQGQGGKVNVPRKAAIKITDPKTHEELRLDRQMEAFPDAGQSALRPLSAAPSQTRTIPSFVPPSHPLNFYPNSYSPGNLFFPAPNSLPLTSGQMMPLTQPSRFNYPVSQGSQNLPFLAPNFNPLQPTRPAGSMLDHSRDILNSTFPGPPRSVPVTVKPPSSSNAEKLAKPGTVAPIPVEKGRLHEGSENAGSCPSQLKNGGEPLMVRPMPVVVGRAAACTADNASGSPMANPAKVVAEQVVPSAAGHAVPSICSLPASSPIHPGEPVPPAVTAGPVDPLMIDTKGSALLQPAVQFTSMCLDSSAVGDDHAPFVERASCSIGTNSASSSPVDDGCSRESVGELELTTSASNLPLPCSDAEKHNGISPETCSSNDTQNGADDDVANSSPASDHLKCPSHADRFAMDSSEEFKSQSEEQSGSQIPVSGSAGTDLISDGTDMPEPESPDPGRVQEESILNVEVHSNKEKSSAHQVFVSAVESDGTDLPDPSKSTAQPEGGGVDSNGGDAGVPAGISKDQHVEFAKPKGKLRKKTKELKEITQKADAAGTNPDDCLAYKAPAEKKGGAAESSSDLPAPREAAIDAVLASSDVAGEEKQGKVEPDDWEDAAEVSAPKEVGMSENGEHAQVEMVKNGKHVNIDTAKRYSRDFLMKFSEKCLELPEGFDLSYDVLGALVSVSVSHRPDRDAHHHHHGRASDRPNAGSRMDHRRGNVIGDEDRRSRLHGPYVSGKDLLSDSGYGGSAGFRPGQGRNPRSQMSMQNSGGILSGPMHPMSSQGVGQRISADVDRWQRATNYQLRGLIPSPQASLPAIHRAEKKYEVGQVADVEEAKKRQLKSILNKLTPQNFEKLFEQVKSVNIDNTATLTGVISQIFDKALMEPTFCEMYADFCYHLDGELPDFVEDNEKITFKKLLLNKCQAEFEKGEREQEEANKYDEEEGRVSQSEEEREEKRIKARRRMFGNIRLIGELYKKGMLTERIMHGCINTFLGQYQSPDEENIEALCKLMSTIGEVFDNSRAKVHMDAYFQRMAALSIDAKLSSRVRFMLKDAMDLRKNKWQQRRKVEGPKKIEDVHRDAVQERQQAAGRVSRNSGASNYPMRKSTAEFGSKGSNIPPSNHVHNGTFRSSASQPRGFGTQDVRAEERQFFEARTLSVPRQLGDDSIMLGPQGGLARGMSNRGSSTAASAHPADISSGSGETRRTAAGLNGFSTISERSTPSSRADHVPRYAPEKNATVAPCDHAGAQDERAYDVSRDRNHDRAAPSRPPQLSEPTLGNANQENVQPEEHLRKLSMEAIKEFYSARDEKEVALCIRDLNCPSFHPSVVSLWVTDSFERKAAERDLLAKLLVNLTGLKEDAFSQTHLVEGFEAVLTALEDAVNDAPRAAEFLGHIFGSVVLDNVVPLGELGRLLHDGGEEPGRLLQIGLAGDVLGSTLEVIRSKRGQVRLNEVLLGSNLILEDFLPPNRTISNILHRFL